MLNNPLVVFIAGTLFGAFVSQNYNIPNIENLFAQSVNAVKILEEKLRKDGKNNDEDK